MKIILLLTLLSAIKIPAHAQESVDSVHTFISYFTPHPEFPGGMDSLFAFIEKNFQWYQGVNCSQ